MLVVIANVLTLRSDGPKRRLAPLRNFGKGADARKVVHVGLHPTRDAENLRANLGGLSMLLSVR